MPSFSPNTLYYGDNLTVLRNFPPECVDLVYLDPPFNSNRSYTVLFKESKGTESEAQIQAFEDTWHWGKPGTTTHEIFHEVVSRGDEVGSMLGAFVDALGYNDVTAYLTMMTPRLVELRRVMKSTGSIYLHCDPTASHYLKAMMDAVFGAVNFKNEIIWKRTTAHSDVGQGARHYGRIHDALLFYSKSRDSKWTTQYGDYAQEYVDSHYRHIEEGTGRRYQSVDLTAAKPGGDTEYPWTGPDGRTVMPYKGRFWAFSRSKMEQFERAGKLVYTRTGMPRQKVYLDEMPGIPLQSIWTDIHRVGGSRERLGYPTQKPQALLERIIQVSSNPGDVILDPFCGCGTAVAAAHKLGRKWIGIDVTFLAVDLIRNRLATTFPEDFRDGIEVDGEPADEAAALALAERDKFQFQFWAVAKLGGTSRGGQNKKGADQGVDGVLAFPEMDPKKSGDEAIEYRQVIISVKGGATGPSHVRDLIGAVQNEKAALGVLVAVRTPTRAMEQAATSAGAYRCHYDGRKYPRIQILTAGQIVGGQRIDMPSGQLPPQYTPAPRAQRGRQKRMGV